VVVIAFINGFKIPEIFLGHYLRIIYYWKSVMYPGILFGGFNKFS